ncbi:MAG TPA: metalloregulator ArsR/SmtB family transcription factor [Oceanipulchritudo sp.]|nr:metalloregulator ArsR/SmtB family transcription factor [Oceanipulchritudo sp.]
MEFTALYKGLSDNQRLRILNLLKDGPLCVCHLMEILDSDQVKISKQLRYMKELGLVEGERQAQWMVYRLTEPGDPLLASNLSCLRTAFREELGLGEDLRKRAEILARIECATGACPDLTSVSCCA